MSFERFIPLCSIGLSDLQSSSSRRCIAYLGDGKQCGSLIPEHDLAAATKIRVQYDAGIDGEREGNLATLAKLYLCSEAGHNTDENVKAAVQQWVQTKWPIGLRVARSISPSDSEVLGINTSTDEGRVFKFSLGTQSKNALNDATYVYRELKKLIIKLQKATTDSNKGYIYIRTHPAAPGFTRIQHSKIGPNQIPSQKCYPGLKLHCCVHCPYPETVESFVLFEFADRSRVHKCEEGSCKSTHTKWIEAAAERLEESVRAWAELVEICHADNTMINTLEKHLYETIFCEEEDKWLKRAKKTTELLKVLSASASLPTLTLPLRPAPMAHNPSETSFISSATTTFSEAPHPVTPCTPPEIRDESVTPLQSATGPAPDSSPSRPHFMDWMKGKAKSLTKPQALQKPEGSEGRRSSEVFNLVKGFWTRRARMSL